MKAYTIVLTLNSNLWLELSEKGAIQAYKTKEEAVSCFSSFRRMATSTEYTNHISGSMGIISIRPHILHATIEELSPHVLEPVPSRLHGQVIGGRIDVTAVPVREEILQYSVLDVCRDIIDEVYHTGEYSKPRNNKLTEH